jgi:putative oxidoreductase
MIAGFMRRSDKLDFFTSIGQFIFGGKRRNSLQKLFCTFPSGSPGLGLLLLRGFVALTLIVQGLPFFRSQELPELGWFVAAIVLVCAACLLVGFLTPIIATITSVGAIAGITSGLQFPAYSLIALVVLAVAIALLGPGAFSIDSQLFGRREILILHGTRDVRH